MIIAQVCLRLATIKGHSKMCRFTVLGGSENQSVSGVTTICLTQCNTSPLHRVDQVVDCGLRKGKERERKGRDVWPSTVTHTWNLCSAFNPSKCTHTVVNTDTL